MIDEILYTKLSSVLKKEITKNNPRRRINSPESQDLVTYIKKIAKYDFGRLTSSKNYDHIIKSSIDSFYFEFLKKNNVYNETQYANLYSNFEDLVYNKAKNNLYALVDWKVESPLIIDEMRLRATNQTEIQDLFKDVNFQSGFVEIDYFVIETREKPDFDDLVDALNIFKNNFGRIYATAFIPMKYYPCETYGMQIPLVRRANINYNPPTLLNSEIIDFEIFYKLFKKHHKQAQMKIAIERYNLGMQALSFEDSIIDFVIALECLVGDDQELTHKISIRIALLLGTTEVETEKNRMFMRDVYSIRSKITHGNQYKTKPEIVDELKKIVNKCLKAFFNLLDKNTTIDKIKSELDQCISSPTKRKNLQKNACINISNSYDHL